MPNFTYHAIMVTGISVEDEIGPLEEAHVKAQSLFEDGLVSALTDIGHNGVRSFAVFPTGSGSKRLPQMQHQEAVKKFVTWLKAQPPGLEWFVTYWSDNDGTHPQVLYHHD